METNNLPTITNTQEAVVTKEKISEYLTAFNMTNLTEQEQMQFIEIAIAYQLNPFKREIYCVPYMKNVKNEETDKWEKKRALSIITGYEVYLKRAERTGKLDGWKCETSGDNTNIKAIATIYRKDWKYPFVHEIYLKEAGQFDDNGGLRSMWKKMPKFMLKKVCIAQAFRLCFPDEFGGMPYIADEMPANMTDISYIEPENKTEDKLKNEFQGEDVTGQVPDMDLTPEGKLALLPENIKEGLRILTSTNSKKAIEICTKNEWDETKILNYIIKKMDEVK